MDACGHVGVVTDAEEKVVVKNLIGRQVCDSANCCVLSAAFVWVRGSMGFSFKDPLEFSPVLFGWDLDFRF